MAGKRGTLVVRVIGDSRDLAGKLREVEGSLKKFGDKAARIGKKLTTHLTLPIIAGFGLAGKAASDLGEAINATTVTFGESGAEIVEWSKTTADAMGIARTDALNAAAGFGNMLRSAGLTGDTAADMSRRMVLLAADMGSLHNQDPTEMLDRIRSGLAGEAEPLRRFGVLLSEAAVQQEAVRLGLSETGKDLTDEQKMQARYSVILKQTTTSHGDFANTADSVANATRRATATAKDSAATFGKALEPIMKRVIGVAAGLAEKFAHLSPGMQQTIVVVGLLLAGLGPLIAVIGNVSKALAFLAANPIVLLIAAVVAAGVAIFVFRDQIGAALGKVWNFFKTVFGAISSFLKNWGPVILAILTGPLGLIILAFTKFRDKTFGVFKKVREIIIGAFQWVAARIGGIWDAIGGALKSGINAIIALVERGLNAILQPLQTVTGLVGKIPGLGGLKQAVPEIRIPRLDTGGTIEKTGLAVVHKGETVTPPGLGGGAIINFDFRGSVIANQQQLTDMIRKALNAVGRRNASVGLT